MAPLCGCIYMLIPQLDEKLFVLNGTSLWMNIYVNITVEWRVIYVKWHLFLDAFICFYHSWMKRYVVLNGTSLWMHIYVNITVEWRVIYDKWHLFLDAYIC